MTSFALLKADGTTTSGDWIYVGSFTDDANLMARRNGVQDPAKNDPTGMGYYPTWAWSWPAQPPHPVQPRVGGHSREAVGSQAPRHPVERDGVDRRRAGLPRRR